MYPGVMLGPDTRSSSLSSLGTSLIVTPGSGTPMLPHLAEAKWAVVAPGEVSVVPQDAVIGTCAGASAFSLSHIPCGSAAAALNTKRRREKNVAANSGSLSS